jgi:hypothetical protein
MTSDGSVSTSSPSARPLAALEFQRRNPHQIRRTAYSLVNSGYEDVGHKGAQKAQIENQYLLCFLCSFAAVHSMIRRLLSAVLACSTFGIASVCLAQPSMRSAVNVRLVTDEAEAVLAVLAKKKTNQGR